MAALPLTTCTVEIASGYITIPAYLAEPKGSSPAGAVVVLQEVFGVNAHIRAVADRLAEAGYCAIAPHIYHRQAPGFEVGYSAAELALGRQYKLGTRADELLSDIQGAIDFLATRTALGAVPSLGCGCIGFCFGGHVAYLAATLPAVKATALFYGAGIVSTTPGGGPPTLSRTAAIGGTVYGFFGDADALIPTAEVDQIEAELRRCRVPHQIFRYQGADHGFFCDQRQSYQPEAARHAWQKALELFEAEL